jgi:hypothetical protein
MIRGILILLCFSQAIKAQKGIEIQISAYPGYTEVNFEKALGYSDEYMRDWDQFCYSGAIKGFLVTDKLSYGAELSWQRLYYAFYRIPYAPSPVYREFDVSTVSITGIARYSPKKKFFVTGGAGIHFFNDGIAPALLFEPGYSISLGENLNIPVSLRLNPVFGDGTPITACLGIGVNYRIR